MEATIQFPKTNKLLGDTFYFADDALPNVTGFISALVGVDSYWSYFEIMRMHEAMTQAEKQLTMEVLAEQHESPAAWQEFWDQFESAAFGD